MTNNTCFYIHSNTMKCEYFFIHKQRQTYLTKSSEKAPNCVSILAIDPPGTNSNNMNRYRSDWVVPRYLLIIRVMTKLIHKK